MIRRIVALGRYLFRSLLFSLAGLLYILLALAFYVIFFDPRQQTPDLDYFILIFGLFGLALSFIVTLSVAARANQAVHYPLIAKLPSRIEYLSSVLLASLLYVLVIQFAVAFLALLAKGPDITLRQLLEIPALWIAGDILFIVIALHATDLVARGWSRVYVFGAIGLLLYLQSGIGLLGDWLFSLFNRIGGALSESGFDALAAIFYDTATWISSDGSGLFGTVFDIIFWPFSAITDAIIGGQFSLSQALAPAVLMIYASLFFLLAAELFAHKDLFLSE
ncbi:MAG: hypothetical protein JSW55_02775 [Chloroflexota bacterium]|nr:MAG: hypothetical protein JSW55_02775 [Chloroflexota bacterium]